MNVQRSFSVRRMVVAVLLAAGLGGCVYAPPYGAYDATYAGYGYPTYVGPPVTLDLGFGYYSGHRHGHYRGHHHGHYRGHHHGWRKHGGGHHRGGWHGGGRRHGRH